MIDLNIFLKTVNFFLKTIIKKYFISRILFFSKSLRCYSANKYYFEICHMISLNKFINYSDILTDSGWSPLGFPWGS